MGPFVRKMRFALLPRWLPVTRIAPSRRLLNKRVTIVH